ncbi:MAG: MFS transporter [Rickettsiales bacterium]|nr:MFS transporter [Rickettsiales bacterium]
MFSFHFHHEPTTRSYENGSSGFSPLPLKKVSDDHEFHWTFGLVKDFAAIFSAIFLSAIGYGILMVMIALKLEANVKNEVLISVSTAVQIGAGVIFSRFLPSMGRKAGMINSIYFGSILSAICSILLYWYLGYFFWLVTVFCIGTSFFICGVTRNTIMMDLAPPQIRAMVISVGTMLVAIGNSLGPIVLNLFKTHDSLASFVLASGFFLASIVPLERLRKVDASVREEKTIGVWRYIKNSPKIMFAAFSVSYAMSSASAFLIIYGIKIGMLKDEASLLLSVLLFGTIFYIPIGYLANILNRRFMMITSATLALVCAHTLFINQNHDHIPILLFLLFGALAGVKLPAIVLINEKYKATQRLAVNSAFSRFSMIGNIFGLFTTGALMKVFGPHGLWLSLILVLSFFLIFCTANYARKIFRGEFKPEYFSIFNKHLSEQIPDA